jgi:hypothetical protein
MIVYGPAGSGKYTLMLRIVRQYSKSLLKYERRVSVPTTLQQTTHMIKISDIHYEVNMELLGCNAKVLWHDTYTHIMEMIQNKFPDKTGLIVCLNFHTVHNELLEIFYSYMQSKVKFILVTEAVSFLPNSILDRCRIVPVAKPPLSRTKETLQLEAVYPNTNLKCAHVERASFELVASKNLTDAIDGISILDLREYLYHILIHNLNAELSLWYLCKQLLPRVREDRLSQFLAKWAFAMNLYIRNYRPLFHLEHFVALVAVELQF